MLSRSSRFHVLLSLIFMTCVTCRPRTSTSSGVKDASENASLFTPGNRSVSWEGRDRFLGTVQPVLASRCVACHGCTDAPCSAKLTNHELVSRGASANNPYAVHPTDSTFPEPRVGAPGFFPTISKSFNDSLMYQFVNLGAKNTTEKDPGGPFDTTKLDSMRKSYQAKPNYECPANAAAFQTYASKNPMAGMPFGLPALNDKERSDLLSWIVETSGQGPSEQNQRELVQPTKPDLIQKWERFLNPSPTLPVRATLVARYLYEHWFNAHIAFDEMPGEFYHIVRTTEAPGPVWTDPNEIVTPLPTDDPGANGKPVYYRFKKITEVVAQKAHVVFELNEQKIDSYQKLFLSTEKVWEVAKLPDYSSTDPFKNFKQIPEEIRHVFMLENSRYIVDSMVRSPVCVGESATYAIADHFWVFFLKPNVDPSSGAKVKMSQEGFDGLNLDVTSFLTFYQVKDRFVRNYDYMLQYEDALRADLKERGKAGLGLEDLWYGESLRPEIRGKNDRNAWLSVTRHDISTTVQYGVRGGMPQSLWVLNYANFERLYYNLVVNFKFWGGVKHKVGEDLFLSMLPVATRNAVRDKWSGGLDLGSDLGSLSSYIGPLIKLRTGIDIGSKPVTRYIDLYPMQSLRDEPRIGGLPRAGVKNLPPDAREYELARLIRDRMATAGVSPANDPLNARGDGESIYEPTVGSATKQAIPTINDIPSFEKALSIVGSDRGIGRYAAWLPASVIARVSAANGDAGVYSFIGNRGYLSHNLWALSESDETSPVRAPERDTLSIYNGVVGDRPELFLDIPLTTRTVRGQAVGAKEFLELIQQMNKDNHQTIMAKIKDQYAVKRNSSEFWPFYDWIHNWMVHHDNSFGPGVVYAGVLDLLRYDPVR